VDWVAFAKLVILQFGLSVRFDPAAGLKPWARSSRFGPDHHL
jgi:hypothetical protein